MPHHVYAAAREVLSGRDGPPGRRAVRKVQARSARAPYRLPLCAERALDLGEW
jgi:hypothetical protein